MPQIKIAFHEIEEVVDNADGLERIYECGAEG